MAEQKYIDFLTKLISATKEQILNWKYLDSNYNLFSSMNWVKSTYLNALLGAQKTVPDFDTEDSFYIEDSGVYIVLLVHTGQPANLYVIPNTFKKIILLTAEEYGEYITRLLNLVQSQFPSGDAYVERFLQNNRVDEIS